MNVPIGIAAVVAFLVVAELGRALIAKLFGYPPERHLIPIMKLPGIRGTTGFRLMLILAGPVAVYLTVAGLAFAMVRCHGTATDSATQVESVREGFDAAGKLEAGDVIVDVDGTPFPGGAPALGALVNAKAGAQVIVTVDRGGATQSYTLKPSSRDGRWLLGVQLTAAREYSTTGALKAAIVYPAMQAARTAQALIELVRGKAEPEAAGPVRIVEEFRAASEVSTGQVVLLTGMIVGTWTLIALALFDLVRALLLVLFRS